MPFALFVCIDNADLGGGNGGRAFASLKDGLPKARTCRRILNGVGHPARIGHIVFPWGKRSKQLICGPREGSRGGESNQGQEPGDSKN